MLNINALENKYKATALTHFHLVCVVGDSDVAFDVIGDIVLSAASQQYGGFTVPCVDEILEPYAEKSHLKLIKKYKISRISYYL